MISSLRIAGALAGVLLALAVLSPAWGQQQTVLPSETHSSVRSAASVPTQHMPSVDTDALRENAADGEERIGPYRYGTVLETTLTPDQHGVWEQLPSGDWLWRLRLRSERSVSLSVGFTRFHLPEGAAVYLHGPGDANVRGPYTAADATAGQHWTPIVRGDELIFEMRVPEGQRSAVDLEIGRVVHGFRSLNPSPNRDDLSKSGACNLDVACEEADPWRKQVRSVGRYSFEQGGRAYVCTGALVNNTAQDNTPYFLTAEHCVSSPEVASTMVFYWNYQNPTCRTPGTPENGRVTDDSQADQTSSGAVLRARYGDTHSDGSITGKPDLSLVEVDDKIPDSYDLYFSGWSRAGTATTRSVTIHHPSGHGKRISFDEDPSDITAYGSSEGGDTHLRIGDWEVGTTEGGSSGAPLYGDNQKIVGVLSGGFAGCGNDGDAEDNNEPDWYGRLAPGFENGDYQSQTLADVLDPKNTGKTTLAGRPQGGSDDQTPPATVDDLTVDSVEVTSMTLQWTAPGDDGDQGTAAEYDIRYSTSRITSKNFRSASSVSNPPPPSPAGTSERHAVEGLTPDSTYYFAIKATDDANNTSSMGTTPSGTFLPDQVPPAPVSDAQLTNINTSAPAVTLSWTATGDDGKQGSASRYHVWYDTNPIQTAADTQAAQQVVRSNSIPAGQQRTVSIEDSDRLQQGQTYYFAIVAEDNAGNRSSLVAPERKAVLAKDIEIEKGGVAAGIGGGTMSETQFVLNESQEVRVALYDVLGRRVQVLLDERVREGFERVVQVQTNSLSSGPYFLHFRGESFTTTRKIVVVN